MQERIYHFGYQQKAKKHADILEIRRLSSQKDQAFREFCQNENCKNFTEINVIYKDEDEDWVDLMPLWTSKHFENLSNIYLKEYPLTDEEKYAIKNNIHNFPSLQIVQIDNKIYTIEEILFW